MSDFEVAGIDGFPDFGAVVTGLSPDAIDRPETRQALYDLWIDRGLVIFKGITDLDTQIRLSEICGEPAEHPLLVGVDRPREHKAIAPIEYDPDDGDLYEIDGELRGGFLPWHYDLAYLSKINHGGILRPVELPNRGGETGFIDRISAYDDLPEELRTRIESLSVIHTYQIDSTKAKFTKRPDRCLRLSRAMTISAEHPSVKIRAIHPMVYTQKETGRKVLNVSPWHAVGIEGMENEEGDALLREVIDHSVSASRAYYHHWQANDMVLWDNWRMLHCALGIPAGEKRRMRRTTIAGDYALGRSEAARMVA